ncbi:hypothetical protein EYF80_010078 [Liparis tanakae]|uniref:Uncharacterized protein n=1 Tax=Liparis tanakae TaxID=230148 RepID=A0A4Z2IQB0_9TELE|nr:hypothetical protein EYF80_010078 [Liparis tanakae]
MPTPLLRTRVSAQQYVLGPQQSREPSSPRAAGASDCSLEAKARSGSVQWTGLLDTLHPELKEVMMYTI